MSPERSFWAFPYRSTEAFSARGAPLASFARPVPPQQKRKDPLDHFPPHEIYLRRRAQGAVVVGGRAYPYPLSLIQRWPVPPVHNAHFGDQSATSSVYIMTVLSLASAISKNQSGNRVVQVQHAHLHDALLPPVAEFPSRLAGLDVPRCSSFHVLVHHPASVDMADLNRPKLLHSRKPKPLEVDATKVLMMIARIEVVVVAIGQSSPPIVLEAVPEHDVLGTQCYPLQFRIRRRLIHEMVIADDYIL